MRSVLAVAVALIYVVLLTLIVADIQPDPSIDFDHRTPPSLLTRESN
jgi:hypothetical protein